MRSIGRDFINLRKFKRKPPNDEYTVLYLPFDNDYVDYSNGASETHTASTNNVSFSNSIYKKGDYSVDITTGTQRRVEFPDSDDWYFSGDFTIHAWIYPTVSGTFNIVNQFKYLLTNKRVWNFAVANDNTLTFYVQNGVSATPIIQVTSTGTISQNAWSHVAIVHSGNDWDLYINGTNDGSVTNIATIPNWGIPLVIGNRFYYDSGGYYYQSCTGYIDSLYIDKGIARDINEIYTP